MSELAAVGVNGQKAAPDKLLEEIKAQYPRAAWLRSPDGTLLVFRAASLDEWEEFQDGLQNRKRGVVTRQLAQLCCVHPSTDDLKAQFEKYPMFPTKVADALGDLAGMDIEVSVKKE